MENNYNNQQPYGQQPYSQQPYGQQPYGQQPTPPVQADEEVTLGEWIISMIVMAIPCVNIIMMFVWAFGSNVKKSKSNFFKASLIMSAIGIVISIIFSAIFSFTFAELLSQGNL